MPVDLALAASQLWFGESREHGRSSPTCVMATLQLVLEQASGFQRISELSTHVEEINELGSEGDAPRLSSRMRR